MTIASFHPSSRQLLTLVALGALCAAALPACGGKEEGEGSKEGDIDLGGLLDPGGGGFTIGNGDGKGGRKDITADQARALQSASCTGWGGEGETLPVVLQLVVDVSRSMSLEAPGSGRTSKWEATRNALQSAIAMLPPSVSVGVLYYPNMFTEGSTSPTDINACVDTNRLVPIEPLGNANSNHRMTLDGSLRSVMVDGYTPTYDAYTYALENSLIPYPSAANKFMLLITDGAPTFDQGCVNVAAARGDMGNMGNVADAPTGPIVDQIAAAFDQHQIRTFLIGSPGSEESAESNQDMRPWLSQSAVLGGTSQEGCDESGPNFCHLDMTQETDFSVALSNGLRQISGQIIDECSFQVPEPPDGESLDPNETHLVIEWNDESASLILPSGEDDCTDGWRIKDAETIELCPQTCTELKNSESEATVQLTFGCSSEETEELLR